MSLCSWLSFYQNDRKFKILDESRIFACILKHRHNHLSHKKTYKFLTGCTIRIARIQIPKYLYFTIFVSFPIHPIGFQNINWILCSTHMFHCVKCSFQAILLLKDRNLVVMRPWATIRINTTSEWQRLNVDVSPILCLFLYIP